MSSQTCLGVSYSTTVPPDGAWHATAMDPIANWMTDTMKILRGEIQLSVFFHVQRMEIVKENRCADHCTNSVCGDVTMEFHST